MSVQVIKKDGKPEWAVIPYQEYERLLRDAEMLQDIRAYDEAKKAVEEGEEIVPSEVVYALLDGENPIRVWREYRGLTQRELAEVAVWAFLSWTHLLIAVVSLLSSHDA